MDGWSLSRLGAKGIDVHALQGYCKTEYAKWCDTRLRSVVAFLQSVDPVPDIALFPEGAVPLESLGYVRDCTGSLGVTVLAGTHTPLNTPAGLRAYADLGISAHQRKSAMRAPGSSVLPMIRNGKVALLPKRLPSVFERTDIAGPVAEIVEVSSHPIQTRAGKLEIVPLVCIEALALQSIRRSYNVVSIVSYDSRPDQFQPFIEQQVRNRKSVLYCNDGHFGGTRIGVVQDQRAPSWLRDTFPDGLPPCDSIIVVDIDLDTTAVEVGTAAPHASHRLVMLASVIGEYSRGFDVSRELPEILQQAPGAVRAERLERVIQAAGATGVQQARLIHLRDLERRGIPSAEWWAALGNDCVVSGQENLDGFEARLAAACRDSLTGVLTTDVARRPDVAPFFLESYTECTNRAGNVPKSSPVSHPVDATAVVDRDAEVRSIAEFLRDAAARAAGDLVLAIGFLAQLRLQPPVAGRQMQEIGDQAVAKQRDGLVVGGDRQRELTGISHRFLLARNPAGKRDPQPEGGPESAPMRCWGLVRRACAGETGRPNPSGRGSADSNGAARARKVTRAWSVASAARTALRCASPANRSGRRVTTISNVVRTRVNRRRTHRTADGSTMSGRRTSAAASMLGAVSTCATTRSRSSRSPGNRLARQSGSRLKVSWAVGQ